MFFSSINSSISFLQVEVISRNILNPKCNANLWIFPRLVTQHHETKPLSLCSLCYFGTWRWGSRKYLLVSWFPDFPIFSKSRLLVLPLSNQQYLHCHQQSNHFLRHQKQLTHPPKQILCHCRLLENIHLEQRNFQLSDWCIVFMYRKRNKVNIEHPYLKKQDLDPIWFNYCKQVTNWNMNIHMCHKIFSWGQCTHLPVCFSKVT